MTEPSKPSKPSEPAGGGGRKPLVISPAAAVVALALIAAIIANLYLDAGSKDYDGLKTTGILAVLFAGVLGFDLKFPGRGDR